MRVKERIFLASPNMNGREMRYISSAFSLNRIAPNGENVDLLEAEIRDYIGVRASVATSSGTAAIHMGLKYLGVTAGDVVFCSDATFSASCNPIKYLNAEPWFIDSDEATWNMSPTALEAALQRAKKAGRLPKAVVVVDLYGYAANYERIISLCQEYGVPILEDAAEALGATYKGKKCGTFGKVGILSFNSNKIITTSGGGMLLTDDVEGAAKIKFWTTQAREPVAYYEHREIGYNYRLSNICAGIGCGQMETIGDFLEKKKAIHTRYSEALSDMPISFMPVPEGSEPNHWLTVMKLETGDIDAKQLIAKLNEKNIESRHFWKPMHMQPVYASNVFVTDDKASPVGERLFLKSVCLPSGTNLTEKQQDWVIKAIREVLKG